MGLSLRSKGQRYNLPRRGLRARESKERHIRQEKSEAKVTSSPSKRHRRRHTTLQSDTLRCAPGRHAAKNKGKKT